MNKENITWEHVEKFIKEELYPAHENMMFQGVYGVPRGGLCLAVMISHALNIPILAAPCEDCLIVDDICDSGESLVHYYRDSSGTQLKKYVIATLAYKENKLGVVPDFYMFTKTDKWIAFPWELEVEEED